MIALLNLLVLIEITAAFRRVRRGEPYCERTLDAFLADRGLMGRFFKPLLRSVGRSWHMYPIGVLFGLGFDTATEVGLLGIAAVEGTKGLPIFDILLFPLLFTVGMSLLDTADGILMLGAYGWAHVKPIRKVYYNMTITLVSVIVAVLVGTVEVLSVVGGQLSLHGVVWERIAGLEREFRIAGLRHHRRVRRRMVDIDARLPRARLRQHQSHGGAGRDRALTRSSRARRAKRSACPRIEPPPIARLGGRASSPI